MSIARNKRSHRNQLIEFMMDYLATGTKHASSAEYLREKGLDICREQYPLVRIVDLVAIDAFVETSNLK